MTITEARTSVVLSDIADDVVGRTATIYQVAVSSMTSGPWGKNGTSASDSVQTRRWRIRFDVMPSWPNRLMSGGHWRSSQDTLSATTKGLKFDDAAQAVLFCERNGWAYEVNNVSVARLPIGLRGAKTVGNQYSYNIYPLAVQLAITKAGLPRRAKNIFAYDASPVQTGDSTWTNLRTTGFGPDEWRPRKATPQTNEAWTGPCWPGAKNIPAPGEEEEEHH